MNLFKNYKICNPHPLMQTPAYSSFNYMLAENIGLHITYMLT